MATNVYLGQAYTDSQATLTSIETTIAAKINTLSTGTNQPTQADLLELQYRMQTFSFFTEFVSTFEKRVGEAFQGIVRNF